MLEVFSKRIKAEREQNNISVKEMAGLLKISPRTYYSYEKTNQNSREPDLATLVQIAKILETTTDYLLGLTD